MKRCSKCIIERSPSDFHVDKERKDGLYPSCKDCRRNLYGQVIRRVREERHCSFCGDIFSPRNAQVDQNKTGLFFCCANHRDSYKIETRRNYYIGYRKYILDRDGNQCVLCGSKYILHVHHIIFRSQGGTNEYGNLITLCGDIDRGCHMTKAHGVESKVFRENFLVYTSQFERPEFWDEVMKISSENSAMISKNCRKRSSDHYLKIKNSPEYSMHKERQKILRKKRNDEYKRKHGMKYTTYIEKFKRDNNGMTPWKLSYKRNKEWKEKMVLKNGENSASLSP